MSNLKSNEVCLTGLNYGDAEGNTVVVEGGSKVPKDIPQNVLDDYRANGAIGEAPPDPIVVEEEKEALLTRIDKLQKALAEAQKPKEPVTAPQGPVK